MIMDICNKSLKGDTMENLKKLKPSKDLWVKIKWKGPTLNQQFHS